MTGLTNTVLRRQETRWKGGRARAKGEEVNLNWNMQHSKNIGWNSYRRALQGFGSCCPKKKRQNHVTESGHKGGRLNHPSAVRNLMLRAREERLLPHAQPCFIRGSISAEKVRRSSGGKGVGANLYIKRKILDLAIAHELAVCSTFLAQEKRARK